MASIAECLESAVAAGRMSRQDADELTRKTEEHTKRLVMLGEVTPEQAMTQAELRAIAQERLEISIQRRQRALQAIALDKAVTRIMNHPRSVGAGAATLLARPLRGETVGGGNVETRARAILGMAHSRMAEAIAATRTKWFGLTQDRAMLQRIVRELFGQDTGSADARSFARAWAETAEDLRQQFNRAGGAIANRSDWYLPQSHDAGKVSRVSREDWIEFTRPLLNRERMLNSEGAPLTDPELDQLLSRAYDTIASDGLVDMQPGRQGGQKLANRHREARVLSFRDGDAWLEYQQRFGGDDVFQTMADHMERMAHEISMLEILGPNPAASWRYVTDVARKHGAGATDMQYLDALYNTVAGSVNQKKNVWLADFAGATRNWITSARLGSALLSQLSDIGFMRSTARWNGMKPTKVMRRFVSMMMEGPTGERRMLATKAGLTAEMWITRALAANRWTDVAGAGMSAKAADFTMRASGMSMWNDSMKKAFQMEFLGFLAENAGRRFTDLPDPLKRTLRAYDFDADGWEQLRRMPTFDHDGARFMSPEKIMRATDLEPDQARALAMKLQEMTFGESRYAVPEADARTRVITTGGRGRGTIGGEVVRSFFQFKSFPISVMLLHISRGLNAGSFMDKAGYLSGMVIGTTLLGALALQAKEVTRGRDPRTMFGTPEEASKFWAAAFAQGGGAGIYGDFLFSDVNRFGSGLTSTFLGPGANLIDDTAKVTLGNVQQFVRGEEMGLTNDLIGFAGSYAPGVQLWYSRLAFERAVIDQLEELADPVDARRRHRRTRQRFQRDRGQDFWWRPGSPTPDRAPDPEEALR
jgi:hypothetical protein